MSSVFRRKDGRWCGKYTDVDGRERYVYRKTKSLAKAALEEAIRDRDDGIVQSKNLTVGTLLDHWLEDIKDTVSNRTWINQELIVRRHLKTHIGRKMLSKLSPEDVRTLYRVKLAELSSGTVKRIHTTLNQAPKEAVVSKYRGSDPLDGVKPPKELRSEIGNPLSKKLDCLISLTFHQLRHTSCSLLLNSGVPVVAVSKFAGHANSGITLRTYAHLIEGMDGLAAKGMDSIFEDS